MRGFWRRSLRMQLVLVGLGAVILPLIFLVGVVGVTNTSEEVLEPAFENQEEFSRVDSREVPTEVAVAGVLLALAGSVAVWRWSGRAVRPMAHIAEVANEIQAGSLDRRIGASGGTAEVRALSDSFDKMLDRLSVSSTTQQQLIEDASHELRTPLAALAVNNEVVLNNPAPTIDDYREAAERNDQLIARLQLTIDELLSDARTRNRTSAQVDTDLMRIVRRVAEEHRLVNPEIPIDVAGPPSLLLGIDGPSVQRAIANLVENAARYSPEGAPIEVTVLATADPELAVTDYGPGIDDDAIAHIFDRYYRVGREDGGGDEHGVGIGLALVKHVAQAHGSVRVESPVPGRSEGTRFTMTFRR